MGEVRTNWPSFPQDGSYDEDHENKVSEDAAGSPPSASERLVLIYAWSPKNTHNAGHTLVSTNSTMALSSDGGCEENVEVHPNPVSREMYVVAPKNIALINQKGYRSNWQEK